MSKFKEFYNKRSKLFQRFWGTQVFSSIMGILISMPIGVFAEKNPDYRTTLLAISLFMTAGLFCFLVYDMFFQYGAADHTKISRGTAVHKPFNGLVTVLFAYIPTAIMLAVYTILYLANVANVPPIIAMIYNLIFNGMYMSLINIVPKSVNAYNHLLYAASLIPAILAAFGGYYLGSKDKMLRTLLGFTVKVKKE